MKTLRAFIGWMALQGVTSTDTDDQRARKGIINLAAVFVCMSFIILIGPFYIWRHESVAGWAYIFVGLFISVGLVLIKPFWKTHKRFFLAISCLVMPIHLIIHIQLGGFVEAGGILFWGLAHPVLSNLILNGSRSAWRWFVLYLLNLSIGIALTPFLTPTPNLPPVIKLTAFALSFGLVSFIIMVLLTYFVNQMEQAYQLLHGEQEKTENLLLNTS